jgi:hypothetical protein
MTALRVATYCPACGHTSAPTGYVCNECALDRQQLESDSPLGGFGGRARAVLPGRHTSEERGLPAVVLSLSATDLGSSREILSRAGASAPASFFNPRITAAAADPMLVNGDRGYIRSNSIRRAEPIGLT